MVTRPSESLPRLRVRLARKSSVRQQRTTKAARCAFQIVEQPDWFSRYASRRQASRTERPRQRQSSSSPTRALRTAYFSRSLFLIAPRPAIRIVHPFARNDITGQSLRSAPDRMTTSRETGAVQDCTASAGSTGLPALRQERPARQQALQAGNHSAFAKRPLSALPQPQDQSSIPARTRRSADFQRNQPRPPQRGLGREPTAKA